MKINLIFLMFCLSVSSLQTAQKTVPQVLQSEVLQLISRFDSNINQSGEALTLDIELKKLRTDALDLIQKLMPYGAMDQIQIISKRLGALGNINKSTITPSLPNSVDCQITEKSEELSPPEQAAVKEMFNLIALRNVDNSKLRRLLEQYPKIVNQKDAEGWTALMRAAQSPVQISGIFPYNSEAITWLIAADADQDMRNAKGQTALDIAKLVFPFGILFQEAVEKGEKIRKNYQQKRRATKGKLDEYIIPDLSTIITEYACSPFPDLQEEIIYNMTKTFKQKQAKEICNQLRIIEKKQQTKPTPTCVVQ